MRSFLLAAVMLGVVSGARAADLPDFLRGSYSPPAPRVNWEGWYVGGQVGYTSSNIDLTNAPLTQTNFLLRNSVIQAPVAQLGLFSAEHAQANGFGAFVGRNYQWDDIVYGLEANYIFLNNLSASAQSQLARRFDNPGGLKPPAGHIDRFDVTLTGAASLQIKDVTTFRGRVGWATGNFLPYAFGGLAIGRLAVARSVTVLANEFDVFDGVGSGGTPIHTETLISSQMLSQAEVRGNNYTAGYTFGLGTEMLLFGNVFARVEWEYVKFLSVKDITSDTNSARLGIGYRF